MDFRAKQVLPPKDWVTFEDLCQTLFKRVWNDPTAHKNGRRGQVQHGVDVYGYPNGGVALHGVQCKGKDAAYGSKATIKEVLKELKKAELFVPTLSHWIFATTAPVDRGLQQLARQLSAERQKEGRFTIEVLGWGDFHELLADHLSVAEQFYPEQVFDVPGLLKDLATSSKSAGSTPLAEWVQVTFSTHRDLGPALMGRSLGPADAISCPRLEEADTLVSHLSMAFTGRLVGEPGAGKSVCAMQAALTLSHRGFVTVRLSNPQADIIRLPEHSLPTLFFIDDAHLLPPGRLDLLEQQAGPDRLVLSTLNAQAMQLEVRGAVTLDAGRAVRTIAADLRRNRAVTLAAVKRADRQVGENSLDYPLEVRIQDAEQSSTPWQFCFVLGGGWQRAKEAADAARQAEADLVLAAVAMRQLASRDGRATADDIAAMCAPEGLEAGRVLEHLAWLFRGRHVLSEDDCRTPHQRFSAVVLHQILIGRSAEGREQVFRLIRTMLCDPGYPLLGLRTFLEEFRFGSGNYRWWHTLPLPVLHVLADRCWMGATDDDRFGGALVLTQLQSFCKDKEWADEFVRPMADRFAGWISSPGAAGYGLANLLNSVINADRALATQIVDTSDARALAVAFSHADEETAFGRAELAERAHVGSSEWLGAFSTNLDRKRLVGLAESWKTLPNASRYIHMIKALVYRNEELALDMAEALVPVVADLLREDTLRTFHELGDYFDRILRVIDVLGVYLGKFAPTSRHRAIARRVLSRLDPTEVARQIKAMSKREMQTCAMFLVCLTNCAPRKAAAVADALDWKTIGVLLADDWARLTHDGEVLIGVLSGLPNGEEPTRELVESHADRIEHFPLRLAVVSQQAALRHIEQGRSVGLAGQHGVDWVFGPFLLALLAEERPDLLNPLLVKVAPGIAKTLSGENSSWFTDAAPFLEQLKKHARPSLWAIIRQIDAEKAEKGWADSLSKSGGAREAVAILVDEAMGLDGNIQQVATRLRRKYPHASKPKTVHGLLPTRRRRKR